jgi:hypothetical protein
MAALLIFSSASAFGWGNKGHQIVSYVGAHLTTDGQVFWGANLQPMRQLATVPDRVWKSSNLKAREGYQHYFQIDAYYTPEEYTDIVLFPSSYANAVTKYSEAVIVKNGTAPWRIRQLYNLAVQKFMSGDMKAGLEIAGAMSHYVGDLSQPLHVTENYNGQFSGNNGIHSYFETTVIGDELATRADVQQRAEALLQDADFLRHFDRPLMDVILLEIERSITYKEEILRIDTQYGRSPEGARLQLELAKDRMADGAATLALILSRLWKDTRLVANATPLPITDPSWVTPDFSELNFLRGNRISAFGDDCNQ